MIISNSKILCQITIVQREKAHLMRFYSSPAVRGYLSDRDLISIHRTKTAQVRKSRFVSVLIDMDKIILFFRNIVIIFRQNYLK